MSGVAQMKATKRETLHGRECNQHAIVAIGHRECRHIQRRRPRRRSNAYEGGRKRLAAGRARARAGGQAGCPAEREELVEAFVPLIGSVARIYRHRAQVNRGELMQEGVVGLLRALERFDPDSACRASRSKG
jgi:DNA-directed RNA polymerase sigma subunit (sigma70/sigma32)